MSKSRQRRQEKDTIILRSFGVTYPYGRNVLPHVTIPPRALDWHKLICASRGVLTVRAERSAWVAPPHRAVWIPAGLDFAVQMHGTVALRVLYLKTGRRFFPGAVGDCVVLNVSPLLRELILRTVQVGALDSRRPEHRRLAAVMFDELRVFVAQPLHLPVPRDARAEKFAELIEFTSRAGDRPQIAKILRQAAASRRTMERIFRDETGMSLGQWLRRQKLLDALRRLAAGDPVNAIAFDLGYNSPSAFTAMFRRELGATPKRYFES